MRRAWLDHGPPHAWRGQDLDPGMGLLCKVGMIPDLPTPWDREENEYTLCLHTFHLINTHQGPLGAEAGQDKVFAIRRRQSKGVQAGSQIAATPGRVGDW